MIQGLFLAGMLAAAGSAGAADWRVRVSPFNQLFPALELSQGEYSRTMTADQPVFGTGSGLISFDVRAKRPGEKLLLEIALPALHMHQTFSARLPRTGVEYRLNPPITWNADALQSIRRATPMALIVSLRRDDGKRAVRHIGVRVHAVDEALYFARQGGDRIDLSWVFAAYVDGRSGIVTQILDGARNTHITRHFTGYVDARSDDVYRQVWAIWQAVSEHGIHYSNADPTIERGPHLFTQRVRSLHDIWTGKVADCIDSSVLIASVLQRIGLHSFLVLVPRHAFVGFYADTEARQPVYLETTLLGLRAAPSVRPPPFAEDVPGTAANRRSLAGFAAALAAGQAGYRHAAEKLDGRHRPDYAVIDIPAARALGIVPIGTAANRKHESP